MAGRGRGNKRSPRSKTAATDAGAAGENLVAMQPQEAQSTMLLSTPLATLMKVEATLWINSRGADSLYNTISLDKFYSMAREHEWLSSSSNSSSSVPKSEADTKTITEPTMVPISKLSNEVYEMVHQLSEEERLLFDVMIVSSWNSTEMIASNFYPLYRLTTTKGKKIGLEILKPPQSSTGVAEEPTTMAEKLKLLQEQSQAKDTKPSGTNIATRSVVLGNMYQRSRQYLSFGCGAAESNGNSESIIKKWWEHAKSILQMILDHRSSMGASSSVATTNQQTAADGDKKKPATTTKNGHTHHKATSPTKGEMKNMTLEERVRARALLNPQNVKAKQSALEIKISAEATENRALLELASALRAYSQRRGGSSSLGSSSGGGGGSSALDRLKHRGSSTAASASSNNIARLTVQAMIKDARLTWNSIVSETVSDQLDTSGGNKMKSKSGASPMVSIDLSRVLFQLRLQMVSKTKKKAGDADVSEKRQMEIQLLNLLEKLAGVVPKWIHLRKAPTLALAVSKDGEKKPSAAAKGKATPKLNIRQSIIVIRNDSVDYATDVRAKLGGRVHNKKLNGTSAAGMSSNSKGVAGGGTKRSLNGRGDQHLPVSAADAIVPPSFRRIYGKALDERIPKKVKKNDK